MYNKVILIGRLTSTPDYYKTNSDLVSSACSYRCEQNHSETKQGT